MFRIRPYIVTDDVHLNFIQYKYNKYNVFCIRKLFINKIAYDNCVMLHCVSFVQFVTVYSIYKSALS